MKAHPEGGLDDDLDENNDGHELRSISSSGSLSTLSSLSDLVPSSNDLMASLWEEEEHGGISDVDEAIFEAFLNQIELSDLRPALKKLGARKVKDLSFLTEADVDDAGFSPTSKHRLFNAIEAYLRRSKRKPGSSSSSHECTIC